MKNATVAYLAGLKPTVVTDKIRMYVINSTGNACTRFELLGCDPTGTLIDKLFLTFHLFILSCS